MKSLFFGTSRGAAGSSTGSSDNLSSFQLGNRGNIIFEQMSIAQTLPGSNHQNGPFFHMEEVFYNLNLAIVDNATTEFEFILQFFVSPKNKLPISNSELASKMETEMACMIFGHVFEPVFEIGNSLLEMFQTSCFDTLGILLCLRTTPKFLEILQKRQIPTLDAYFNGVNLSLWPRFQTLMDIHSDRLIKLSKSRPSRAFDTFPRQVILS
ncbi:Vacuolar protein sorting-associated protein 52 B [Smittium mucronatum]|uniref:Vacuolar protein sorting-associated protein 52 B n=1 Tax=Smittium mucronatum TaxID=133383 RepID=A0A1R0H5G3_9FUNG|nr:Vacuolar protein sorting-associated protein 52 B [Smittium mucronatum]